MTRRAAERRRSRHARTLLWCAALALGAGGATAEVIDLQWQDAGRFERSLTLAPGKFVEVCGPLQPGQRVQWSFDANSPLNFNIHYHLGKNVRYPAKHDQVQRLQGELPVDAHHDYCWMWVNKAATATRLTVALTRR